MCSGYTFLKKRGVISASFYDVYVYSRVPVVERDFAFNLIRPRVNLDISPFDWLKFVLSGDFEFYGGDEDSIAILDYELNEEEKHSFLKAEGLRYRTENLMMFSRLYRGYVRFTEAFFTLSLGRQRIDWGKGFFFTPLNPFTPKVNFSVEPDQIKGIDSIFMSLALSDSFSIEGVYAPFPDEHDFGFRLSSSMRWVDLSLLYIRKSGMDEGGMSAVSNLFDGVLKAEVRVPRKMFDFLLGYERTFEYIALIFEYYYHGSDKPQIPPLNGESIQPLEDLISASQTFYNYFAYPGRGEMGTHYIALMLQKDFPYSVSISLMFEMNISDLSFAFLLRGMWSPYSWLEMELGGIIPYGEVNDEFWFMKEKLFALFCVYL